MKKIIAGIAMLSLVCGLMFGVLSVCYAWAVGAMMGCFAVSAVLCVIVNER